MRLASVASIAAFATLLAGSANAMPAPAPYHGDSAITLAAGGCGPAYFRNAFGACVPYGVGGGGVVVAPGFYGGGYGYHGGGYGYHGGGYGYHGGGYGYHGGGYGYHGGGWHGGGWHGGGYHGGGGHWHGGGGAHWHGGGAHFHGGGGHHR
jgi:hypothetical protein